MISDRTVHLSTTTLAAWLLWIAALAGLAVGVVADEEMYALIGLGCSAAAATVHIRSFFCVFASRFKGAFELGAEMERRRQQLERELHSV